MLLKNLAIGNTLESQAYCFMNEAVSLVHVKDNNIFPFELLDESYLSTVNKRELYYKLLFMNSMMGKVLFSEIPDSATISNNTCSLVFGVEKVLLEFERCIIFDSSGLSMPNFEELACEEKIKFIDLFEARGIKKEYDFTSISTGDDFVSNIWPHNSGRVLGSRYVTDFYTESVVPFNDIYEFDVSETMARFKLHDHLGSSRFQGTLSGFNSSNEKVYSKIELEHIERFVIHPQTKYKDKEIVKFNDLNLREIFFGTKK